MKRIITIALALVMALSMLTVFAGCSLLEDPDTQKFYGTWSTTVDMAHFFNDEVATDEEMGEYLQISDLSVVYIYTFNEDGTYSTSVDEDALNATIEAAKAELTAGITRYFEDAAAEYDMTL
ncbi:MAG: hypothetical protein IJP17_03780, partial [Clostridia bacterium]|nr:hypothetical protein [Clostridia bacterium]